MVGARLLAWIGVCLGACGRFGFSDMSGGEHARDAVVGADVDASDKGMFAPSNGAGPGHLDGVTAVLDRDGLIRIDTDTGEIIAGTVLRAPGLGVIAGIRFEVLPGDIALFGLAGMRVAAGATVVVAGARPLLVLSSSDVSIAGVIDVSAFCRDGSSDISCPGPGGGVGGAGAPAGGCAPGGKGVDGFDTGGGGGGFGQTGGAGGDRPSPPTLGGLGGDPAGSCPGVTLEPLQGGSGGAIGGDSSSNQGGGGGGAIQISSYTLIELTGGGIDAGGAGGQAAPANGGCGGGSGGAILLEAPAIRLGSATIAANGGGGGEGGGNANGQKGPFAASAALGGVSVGNAGGSGGSVGGPPTQGTTANDNSAGGGGGAGIIRINAQTLDPGTAIISPAASVRIL